MTQLSLNVFKNTPSRWAAYAIAAIGIIVSIGAWHGLMYELPTSLLFSLKEGLPWVVLVGGISLTLVTASLIRSSQLNRQHVRSLERMSLDLKKELEDHLQSNETRQRLEKALLQGQKLQAIGTLAGGIAHDFNNILYAIIGYVEMARDDVKPGTQVFKNLGKVLDASHRGQDLIARILSFSRRQRHDFKPACLHNTIENVLGLLRPTTPAGVTIIFKTMPQKMQILADPIQLHQVIINIINNAVDAMDGEGIVTLKLEYISPDDNYLKQFPDVAHKAYCKIDISDTGYGMDESTMARIFEPFFTTKEVGKGTGLGLATARAIMKEHKGEITVRSQLGHGTTFTLLLPEYKENENGENSIS